MSTSQRTGPTCTTWPSTRRSRSRPASRSARRATRRCWVCRRSSWARIALGLALTGYLPAAAAAATLPIIIISTGLGQFVAALWAIKLGQSAVACIFGVFSGFWLSYALLLLGLGHGWYGIKTGDVQATVSAFLLTWCIGVGALTGVTLRLPLAFTVLFALVDLALALVLLGNERTSTALTHAGGYVVLLFAALGVYLFAGAASAATGGKPFGLGKPIIS